jgi:hypothetical protein
MMSRFALKQLQKALLLTALSNIAVPARAAQPGAVAPAVSESETNILQLNKNMFKVYDAALGDFQKDFMNKHPVILALFSGAGGRFILYRPGQPMLEASNPPIVYQLAKSVGHTGLALYEIVTPYLKDPKANQGWREPMTTMRDSIKKGLDSVQYLTISEQDRNVLRSMLEIDLAFAESCLKKGTFTHAELVTFARSLKPYIKKVSEIVGTTQTNHWVDVLTQWKAMLGADWEKTYAVTNTIYVTRQNNILFSILAQFMGQETINRRLLLLETTSFTTTPDDMLNLLTRILSDRILGETFFGDYMLMDTELVGSAAREALKKAMKRAGKEAILPEYAHFNSNEWPWRTNPAYGDGPRTMDETPN